MTAVIADSSGFRVGEVVDGTLSFIRRHARALAAPTIGLLVLPNLLILLPSTSTYVFNLVVALTGLMYGALVSVMVYDDACERPVDAARAMLVSRRFGGLIGLSILQGLGVLLGLLCLVIPGVYLMVGWLCATPVFAVEKLGPIAALSRSSSLADGARGRLLLLILIYAAMLVAYGFLSTALDGLLPQGSGARIAWSLFSEGLVGGTVMMLGSIGTAVTYVALRRAKEGMLPEHVTSVF